MTRTITLDSSNNRLVFLNVAPDQAYCGELCHSRLKRDRIKRCDRFVAAEKLKVQGKGVRVVDVGCGAAAIFRELRDAGFVAEGTGFFLFQKVDQT